jgi:hypothetical protein
MGYLFRQKIRALRNLPPMIPNPILRRRNTDTQEERIELVPDMSSIQPEPKVIISDNNLKLFLFDFLPTFSYVTPPSKFFYSGNRGKEKNFVKGIQFHSRK